MADDTDPAFQSTPGENGSEVTTPPPVEDKAPKGRKGKEAERTTTQAAPTAPRARDPKSGLELDEHGLPTSGVARRRWLAEANIEDPALKPDAGGQENVDG
ncbi:hypothetical protein [Sphingopyxis sp. FD7]|uniref:hypothetical protein n=1 Tax=Sphingopyxis sp. FD7 TaxID=1914525 RepID=UPI000DC63F4E|nr:hypothetical protein [Sphingopyxis sp. FD7]BBB13425.1 tudor domain protein 2 [Sphingopyxis sp. FD7]